LGGIVIPGGTTVLKYFAVDLAGNRESVRTQTFVIDIVSPIVTVSSGAPGAMGLLGSQDITWQSNEAGTYVVELGGTGTPGTGTVLSTGSATPATPVVQNIKGTQLTYAGLTRLWVYVTDGVDHTGSTSVVLTLKPMVSINVGGELGQIAILPNGLKVYVAQPDANAVAVIDANPASGTFNTVNATIPMGPRCIRPMGVVATPNGSRVYVTCGGSTIFDIDSISVISTSTDTAQDAIQLGPNSAPNGIAITPDGTRAYFLRFEGEISVLDVNPASQSYHGITARIPRAGLLFGAIAVTPDGTRAIVNWAGSGHAVDVIDVNPDSGTYNTIVSSPVPFVPATSGGGDVAVTSNSGFAFATDITHQLCRINLQTSAIAPTGPLASQSSFALTPDGNTILMGNPNDNNMRVLNASDLTVTVDVPMGAGLGYTGGIAVTPGTPGGDRAYVNRNDLRKQPGVSAATIGSFLTDPARNLGSGLEADLVNGVRVRGLL
jgi:DNA-binding beta-propeller fold protein YncE